MPREESVALKIEAPTYSSMEQVAAAGSARTSVVPFVGGALVGALLVGTVALSVDSPSASLLHTATVGRVGVQARPNTVGVTSRSKTASLWGYQDFVNRVKKGQVKQAAVARDGSLQVSTKENTFAQVLAPTAQDTLTFMAENGVEAVEAAEPSQSQPWAVAFIALLAAVLGGLGLYFRAQPPRHAMASVVGKMMDPDEKNKIIEELMAARDASGLTWAELGAELDLTNVYVAAMFLKQAQLKPDKAEKLQKLVPGLTDDMLVEMMKPPFRTWDDDIMKEQHIYRTMEACQHYGEAMKVVINEQFGDGIMSAIDYYMDIKKMTGPAGEARVVITMNGKYLPIVEQSQSTMDKILAGEFEKGE